ncbi:MAG: 16S rRNA (guanine(966)-N(2))-methyltransferase RsmD [bacterium]|nr:16S rRNA (guanine(966)-N(2))-methyltransferase RsmD [bacterium]
MVRIISGECKGRKLRSLKGRKVRPTSDRAKETLFDMLQTRIKGAKFLDLFAGTGSVGLEAASRGASEAVLVESDPEALKVIYGNIVQCRLSRRVRVCGHDYKSCLAELERNREAFDLVFLDPPYDNESAYPVIQSVWETGLLRERGLVIAEHDRRLTLPPSYGALVFSRSRQVGDTVFSFYGEPLEPEDSHLPRVL